MRAKKLERFKLSIGLSAVLEVHLVMSVKLVSRFLGPGNTETRKPRAREMASTLIMV